MIVYLNGEFLPIEQARISVLDRGFIYGDGVYELIPPDAPFFRALALHHVPAFLREVETTGGQELDGWRPTPYMGVPKLG